MKIPLLAISQEPGSSRDAEPRFDLAVFDDGFVLYSGTSCVSQTGFAVGRLSQKQLDTVRQLATKAKQMPATVLEDQVCVEEGVVRKMVSSDHQRVLTRTNRCGENPGSDDPFTMLVDELVAVTDAKGWIGEPATWTNCGHTARSIVHGRWSTRSVQPDIAADEHLGGFAPSVVPR